MTKKALVALTAGAFAIEGKALPFSAGHRSVLRQLANQLIMLIFVDGNPVMSGGCVAWAGVAPILRRRALTAGAANANSAPGPSTRFAAV